MTKFIPIFLANIFLSLHYASTLYVNSSFLAVYFPAHVVSILFIIGALASGFLFLHAPNMLRQLGSRWFLLTFLVVETIATLGMALTGQALPAAIFFLIYSAALPILGYSLDIFLEEVSVNAHTGGTRGIYLTSTNVSIALAPLLVAFLAVGDNLSQVYFASFFLILPIFLTALFLIQTRVDVTKHHRSAKLPWRSWWRNRGIRNVTMARASLEFFYSLMVIYTPLYLHNIIGFRWDQIGLMFTIMLTAFIIFQWPMGELADRRLGEREIMSLGFIIASMALVAMPFLGHNFALWTAILFISRIGASWIEVTTESYLFKKVASDDTAIISIFRIARPVSIVLAALTGIIMTSLFPYQSIFWILALTTFLSLYLSNGFKDTR